MNEKKDVYEKAKSEMRLSERIVAALPGFRGYKEKELRRESDKLIRNHLHQKLSQSKNDMKSIFQKFSDRRAFNVLTDMDRLVARFDRVAEKVNHASYGYAGFFNVIKIKEEALDRMIRFDSEMIDDADNIISEVNILKTDVSKQKLDEAKEQVEKISNALESFEGAFDKRQEVILGAI